MAPRSYLRNIVEQVLFRRSVNLSPKPTMMSEPTSNPGMVESIFSITASAWGSFASDVIPAEVEGKP
jgi:hypothetical protein